MMIQLKKLIFIALIHCTFSFPTPTEEYMREFVLREPDIYKVYWKYDVNTITFEVHAKTKGWIGFGLSPNGGMPGSDIVMYWKQNDGKIVFDDRHATGTVEPIKDNQQDWNLIYHKEEGEFTILKIHRKLNTCDDKDLEIKSGTHRLIWAFHLEKPAGSPKYHGTSNRGTASVVLLADGPPGNADDIIKDSFPIDITHAPYRIPNNTDTVYRCEIFKLTNPPGKHHVVVVDPLINQDHKTLVHHIIIYGCQGNLSAEVGTTWNCYESRTNALKSCNTIMFAWAIGGGPWFFPENIGFPIGGPNDPAYVRMETHYDNPALTDGIIDTSGLRLWTTKKIRKFDASIIEAGHKLSSAFHVIPPRAKPFISVGHCYSECLTESLTRAKLEEVNVFAVGLHAHLKGYQIKLRHFRGLEELEPIAFEEHYDFNFQEYQKLEKMRVIKKNDRLQVECSYNTENEQNATYGGFTTREEMCYAFVQYYPRMDLSHCQSLPDPEVLGSILNPSLQVDWSVPGKVEEYQKLVKTNRISLNCRGPGDPYQANGKMIVYPAPTKEYEREDYCASKANQNEYKKAAIVFSIIALMNMFI